MCFNIMLYKAVLYHLQDFVLYHLQDFLALWTHLDQDGSGFLDVGEFMRGLLGEISEARMGLVHRAWCRMDPQKTGDVTYTTVRQFFNPVMPLDSDAGMSGTVFANLGGRLCAREIFLWLKFFC